MILITNTEVIENKINIPKGTSGVIIGVEFGQKNGFIVDFPQAQGVYIQRENSVLKGIENAQSKPNNKEEEKQVRKSKR